jgi:TonB family protein
MWLLRRELQSLHEYQADDAVLNEGVDARNYQMLLIKRAVGSRLHSVANCLNHSNLKNRITMMCKKNSSRWAAAKALLVLPVVAISLSAFATTVYVPREVQDKVTENSVNLQEEEKPKPIAIVDGKIVPYDESKSIDPNHIKSVYVYKSYQDEFSKYNITEEQAKNGVVVIELKKEGDIANQNNAKSENVVVVGYSTRMKSSEQFDAAKADFKQAKDDFEQAKDDFKQSDKAFKQAEKDFAKADKAFKQMEKDVQEQDPPYIKVEKMPTFQGGDLNAFRNWMQGQIQYPKEAAAKNISGRVIFSFVVEKDGSTSDFTVLKTPDKLLADEVERIFKTCPKWEPGTQRGEKVRVKYTVPIVFAIQGNNAANEGLKVVGVKSQPKTAESEAAIAEFKKTADIVIKSENGKETYFVNGKEVKKEDVGAYEPEKVVVDGAHSDGVKTVYIKVKK